MANELVVSNKQIELAKNLDEVVAGIVHSQASGFQRLYIQSQAIAMIKEALTDDFMKPIIALQNSKLGFKTDAKEGYKMDIVRDCVIEARFFGLEVTGNMFNIIGGNMYPTKAGLTYKLNNIEGLSYLILPTIPEMTPNKAIVSVDIQWTFNKVKKTQSLQFAIRVNAGMKDDAVVGKAKRAALEWLVTEITKQDSPSMDEDTVEVFDISNQQKQGEKTSEDTEHTEDVVVRTEREIAGDAYIEKATTLEDLDKRKASVLKQLPNWKNDKLITELTVKLTPKS